VRGRKLDAPFTLNLARQRRLLSLLTFPRMMFLMTPAKVDSIIRRYRWWILGGACLAFLGSRLDGFGVITGFMAIWLGACGGTFGAWRDDKGLWVLSALFLALALLCYGGFTYAHVSDIIHRRGKNSDIVDLSFAASLLWMQSRFLLTVSTSNWKLTRRC
jgi:hypothetical protein